MVTYPSDWKITSIDKLGKCYSGLSGKSADDFVTGSAYYITFLNVLKNIKVDMDALEKVSVSSGENQNAVKKGDLFFNTSSETPDEVGMCAVLLSDLNNVYLNSFCFGFRLYNTSVLSPLFASYFFNSIYGRRLMSLYAQGSTRYNLSKSSFIKMEIPVPSIKEQQAIAATLSYFDEHIDNLTELIEKKKAIRDGALEDLVSGRTRLDGFNGEWKEVNLGTVTTILNGDRGVNYPSESAFTSYGVPFVNAGHLSNGKVLFDGMDYISKEHYCLLGGGKIIKNDILFCLRGSLGKFALADFDEGAPASSLCIVRAKETINPLFLAQLMSSSIIKNRIEAANTGSSQPNLSAKDISLFEFKIPVDIEEQQAISSILTAMYEEIESLKIEKEKMIQIKEGAMDDLLTGRVRLNV